MKPDMKPLSKYQAIWARAKRNGTVPDFDSLPAHKWQWPTATFLRGLRYLKYTSVRPRRCFLVDVQAVILRGCLIRECAWTLEPHDFYRPSARLDNTHRGARRPTIASPHPR
jgi:hypothetical protein